MATTTATSDIYKISEYLESIKSKFTDIPEETLEMGIYGYLSEVNSNMLQNTIVMASEYSNEAIPIKAKFERNIIAHALSLGINKIRAKPAYMEVMLCIPEDRLLLNMKDNKFVFDRNIKIFVENYEYHVDYDIIITRNQLPDGSFVYTGQYDIDGRNQLSEITNPYLPPIGNITITHMNLIVLKCTIRQVTFNKIYKKILVDNPLENKIINFGFDKQLAYFNVDVKEGNAMHYLEPVYDGLYDYSTNAFCNYMYIDSSNIRLKFNRDSYEPRINCEVTINVYTTEGATCNFTFKDDIMMDLSSDIYTYDRLFMIVKPISDSMYGTDKKTIEELKRIIPKEALSRGSITTYTDLNNFFNSINDTYCRLYFLEKVHNQLERLYYSYLLLKDGNNIVPTNTLDVTFDRSNFDNINNVNYILQPGAVIYYDGKKSKIYHNPTELELADMEKNGFVYINPFLVVVNKSPFFVSYFLNTMNKTKYLNFNYINQNSQVQFIAYSMNCKREYFTDRDTYKFTVQLLQNINSDFGLITLDDKGKITDCKVKVIGVLYDNNNLPYRYCEGSIVDYDKEQFIYDFQFQMKTNDIIDRNNVIKIEQGLYDVASVEPTAGYFNSTAKMRIYILAKTDKENGRDDLDKYVPNLTGWTLCNKYDVTDGIDLFYNYTNIVSSYIDLTKNTDSSISFNTRKMPLIRKKYINCEDRIQNFVYELEKRRSYIEYCMMILEDSFGIDFKFFNTYGPSLRYNVDNETLLNRVNLTLTFEVKFVTNTDQYILEYITTDIKEYIEDINEINDIHMPNLITYITDKYREQLVYFKFLDFNGYGPVKQSIYMQAQKDDEIINNVVPEFINVNTKDDNTPDISYVIKS